MNSMEKVIENMNIAKAVLCNPNMVTPEICIKIGQTISDAISLLKEHKEKMEHLNNIALEYEKEMFKLQTLLKEQEVRELTIDEWREWKENPKRDPICELWENDTSPMWILNPNRVHEPALLMGKLKLFTGKPTFEQCKAVKWRCMI